MNYFISDLHLGHTNCIAFDNRPFLNIEEHDTVIVSRWNEEVTPDDDVYILGDVSWHNSRDTIKILKQLNGKLHLIKGNHDSKLVKNKEFRDMFVEICDYKELKLDDGNIVVLSHYPIPCFNKHYYGSYHLYGHVHTGFEYNMMLNIKMQMEALYTTACNMYNIGCMVDYMDYTPRTLEYIISKGECKA